jgi:hypothetical protein
VSDFACVVPLANNSMPKAIVFLGSHQHEKSAWYCVASLGFASPFINNLLA